MKKLDLTLELVKVSVIEIDEENEKEIIDCYNKQEVSDELIDLSYDGDIYFFNCNTNKINNIVVYDKDKKYDWETTKLHDYFKPEKGKRYCYLIGRGKDYVNYDFTNSVKKEDIRLLQDQPLDLNNSPIDFVTLNCECIRCKDEVVAGYINCVWNETYDRIEIMSF